MNVFNEIIIHNHKCYLKFLILINKTGIYFEHLKKTFNILKKSQHLKTSHNTILHFSAYGHGTPGHILNIHNILPPGRDSNPGKGHFGTWGAWGGWGVESLIGDC